MSGEETLGRRLGLEELLSFPPVYRQVRVLGSIVFSQPAGRMQVPQAKLA